MDGPALSLKADLLGYEDLAATGLNELYSEGVPERIWSLDHTVWKPGPEEIVNRLEWLYVAEEMLATVNELAEFRDQVAGTGCDRVLLLGMGGSSLCPEVLARTFGTGPGGLELEILDSTDPGAVLDKTARFEPGRTLYIVSSKSGTTIEPLSFFKFFYNRAVAALGREEAGAHFAAITDPGSFLAGQAEELGFRKVFLNNPNIGGRYSALSYFGMVPAALLGLDVGQLLKRGAAASLASRAGAERSGYELGVIMGQLALAGRDKLTILAQEQLLPFGDWAEQLIAESTGKEGKGILPVVGEPAGPPQVYGGDRFFVSLKLAGETEGDEAAEALVRAGHPLATIELRDLYDLGGQFFLWELATAVAGWLMGINPFDQPDVESAKVLAKKMVAEYTEKGALPAETPALSQDGLSIFGPAEGGSLAEALVKFIGQAEPGAYLALQAYIPATPETEAGLTALRTRLRDRFRLAVTVGYGPRFLHSTGQLHKGDAGKGLFIQLTADHPADAAIPDETGSERSAISFGLLQTAQALGDRQALAAAGRRVIRLHLGADPSAGLARLDRLLG